MYKRLIRTLPNLVIITLLFLASVSTTKKIFGVYYDQLLKDNSDKIEILKPTESQLSELGYSIESLVEIRDGIWALGQGKAQLLVVNTMLTSSEIFGYAGPIPMLLYIDSSNQIQHIQALENSETKGFFRRVLKKNILNQWMGKSPNDIPDFIPDVVTGATLSSAGINESVLACLKFIDSKKIEPLPQLKFTLKSFASIFVLILALIFVFFQKKLKKYRSLYLIINTLVLGFWCGSFISIEALLSWTQNGFNLLTGLVLIIMLILTLVMSLVFNKKKFYCTWVCPYGAAQELAGKITTKKLFIAPKYYSILKYSQESITFILFFCMWIGLGTDLAGYEPFSAFLFQNASIAVLIIGCLGIITSIFVPKAWCRFACPTGKVLSWIEKFD